MGQVTCWVDGCTEQQVKWGMCPHHHALWLEHFPRKRTRLHGKTETERFWFYIQKGVSEEVQREFGAKSDCWVWLGHLDIGGYGEFTRTKGIDESRVAHRLSLDLAGVDIPNGMEADHLCRFRPCSNPNHLEPVPGKVNYLRGVGSPAQNARKTHCPQGHQYTPENTLTKSNGWRQCRTCDREHSKAYTSTNEYRERRREAYMPKSGVRGKGQYQAQKTHCKEGHPLEGDNLLLEKRKHPDGSVTRVRRCRICTLAKARDNHTKRKGGIDSRRSDETCRAGHPRTEENTRWTNGKRYCRVCHRERAKKSYDKKN